MVSSARVAPPRRKIDVVLAAMVGVAVLLHAVTMFTWLVCFGTFSHRAAFFSERQRVEVNPVTVLAPGALKPPRQARGEGPQPVQRPKGETARPRNTPTAAPQRRVAAAPAPRRPAAAAHPRQAAAPPAGVRGNGAPRVVAGREGGWSAAPARGTSGGTSGGSDSGTGSGAGSGGGPGGTGTGSGAPAAGDPSGDVGNGGGGGARVPMWLHITYRRPELNVIDAVNLLDKPEPHSWEDLCRLVGVNPAEILGLSHLTPFLTRFGYVVGSRADQQALMGKSGSVGVRVAVDARGTPSARVEKSSGNPVMDSTAVLIIDHSHWLPALDRGQPVGDSIELVVTFDDVPGTEGIVLRRGEGGPPQGGQGQPPVTAPGGQGQAPVSVPGGAGQRPGSW